MIILGIQGDEGARWGEGVVSTAMFEVSLPAYVILNWPKISYSHEIAFQTLQTVTSTTSCSIVLNIASTYFRDSPTHNVQLDKVGRQKFRLIIRTHAEMLFYQSDSDSSESESSGSEDEFCASAFLDLDHVSDIIEEPRRVGRVRRYLLEALLAAFSICLAVRPDQEASAPVTDAVRRGGIWKKYNAHLEDPWTKLESCTGGIGRNMGDKRIKDIPQIIAGLCKFNSCLPPEILSKAWLVD